MNGLGGDTSKVFNGMGCLAASVIAHFKEGAGGFYMSQSDEEEYVYTVYERNGKIYLKCEWYDGRLYEGPVDLFNDEDL